MTPDGKGRGLFASKDLKQGDLLIVEKALADISESPENDEISDKN